MAAKENQGLQAIVIVLTIFLLLTGVGLLLVNNSRKTAVAQVADLQRQNSESQAAQAKLQAEANNYKAWIGYPEDALYDSLTPQFEEDKNRFGLGVDEASRAYKTMLQSVFEEKEKLVKNEANAKAEVRDLKERLLSLEAQKNAQVQEHLTALEKAKKDLADVQAKAKQQYDEISAKNADIAASMEKDRATHAEALAKLNAEKTAVETANAKLERMVRSSAQVCPKSTNSPSRPTAASPG